MARRALAALILALVFTAIPGQAQAASAPDWFEGHSAAERDDIINAMYLQTGHGPVKNPSRAAQATALADHLADVGNLPDAPGSRAIGPAELRVGQKAGLLPRIRDLAPRFARVAGGIGIGVGTFALIANEGGRAMFNTLVAPEVSGGTGFNYNGAQWLPEGYEFYFGARATGEYGLNAAGVSGPVYWSSKPCPNSSYVPPQGARMRLDVPSTGKCAIGTSYPPYQEDHQILINYPYFTEADVYTNTSSVRWTYERYGFPQAWVRLPPTPSPDVATPEIETELESDGADALRAQLDWKMRDDEDPATNPVYYGPDWTAKPATHEHRWCEESSPNTSSEPIDQFRNAFDVFETYSASAIGSATMLMGTDLLEPDFAYIEGFGIRKIAAKHGWNVADRDATALALQRPPVETPADYPEGSYKREHGRYKFEGPDYSPRDPSVVTKSGVCRRVVIVDTASRAE